MTDTILDTTTEFLYDEDSLVCDKVDIQKFGKVFLPVFYTIVFLLGLVGNLLVVFAFLKAGNKKSTADIYLLNLAISDLFFVISLPFWAFYVRKGWKLGTVFCKLISSLYYVGFFGGMFFITVVSIDRYLAIVQVTFSLKSRTIGHGCIITLFVWIAAALFSVPQFVFTEKVNKQCTANYPEDLQIIWPVFCNVEMNVIGFLIPICIMSYCYFRIIRTLLSCKNHKKTRAIRLILVVVIVFFLFWTPYNVLIFLDTLKYYFNFFAKCDHSIFLDYAMHATETLAFSHCCLNPVIYAFAGEKFRKYLCSLCLKCCSFICFCGPRSWYQAGPSHIPPESIPSSNQTQITSDPDALLVL
ncbi:PREDICTED: CX3C chemokine receptor 1 [Crocodylus porosus]|uniref:C-X3-C motif chemokine receptor 1 n=1 Tax=Crocodylus porosus TaxID=8502 RepID=A0A7M4EN19_CROPO|nr:PREDICTED: CX3C chemokine receptor 1 [Crocodylus porosus]